MLAPNLVSMAEEGSSFSLQLAQASPVEIPANFSGLGYEMSSVATPGLLSTGNVRYVKLIRGLGLQGVLRVGGIVANYTRYLPSGPSANNSKDTVITHAALEQFAAFLDKIGWTAIWSVNFAQGSVEEAVQEARAVHAVLGSRLLALEIGNEVDNYGRGQPFRPSSYDYEAYRKEYAVWHTAITRSLPGLPFAAPDTAQSVEWVERMAEDAERNVQLLTTHYYRNGQKRGDEEQLLTPDPRLADVMTRLRTASAKSRIPWRMCEINSFSGGGRPGVSDTFVGALWTLQTMMLLAQNGCAGVNMETGMNQLGFVSSYSPIQDDGKGMNTAGVPYYGMLAFAQALAGRKQLLPLVQFTDQDERVSAYVLGADNRPASVVVVNMGRNDAQVSIAGLGMEHAKILRMTAPSAESKTGVTLGDAAVDASGQWKPTTHERLRSKVVAVPGMSAVILRSARL
jgi:hypothetical protein